MAWYESTAGVPAFPGRYLHASVVYNNAMWVISGDGTSALTGGLNDVWSSLDGITWNQATASAAFPPRVGGKAVTFNDGGGSAIWLISGLSPAFSPLPDTWKTLDGINWTSATTTGTFGGRFGHDCVAYGAPASLWIMGGQNPGYLNDVWSSPDGINWNQKTAGAAFSPRIGLTAVNYGGLMWVIGGYDNAGVFDNDVWSSPDGVTWTQVLANGAASPTQFSGRFGHSCVIYNGALWVIGGQTQTGSVNDVWTSTNGSTWTQVTGSTLYSPRYYHTSVVYKNQMWVIDGFTGGPSSDIWHSP